MKLSEAIKHGSTIRPESHQERFINVEGRGLCSDAWGAAVEAVWPHVAKLNWNIKDRFALARDLRYLNEIQHKYFERYFHMPARCPFAERRYTERRVRVVNRKGETKIEGEREGKLGGVTSECALVSTLAGFVDHAFYVHANSRDEIAAMVECYENAKEGADLTRFDFNHYQSETLRQSISLRVNLAARYREQQRAARRRHYLVN